MPDSFNKINRKENLVCGIGINDYDGLIKNDNKTIKIHRIWSAIIRRCYSPKDKKYHQYGAKGVKVIKAKEYLRKLGYDENIISRIK